MSIIEGINSLVRSCYGGYNPTYPNLSTFEEGKFVNLLIPYLKAEIEKMENPHPFIEPVYDVSTMIDDWMHKGYAEAKEDILKLLEEK